MRLLRGMLIFIGIVQLFFGIIFMLIPAQFAGLVGLETAPLWVNWLFVMMSARFFGFAYGMFIASRQPYQHRHWIIGMVGVQALDWIGTIYYLFNGAVTLAQVSTASFLPLIFIAVLLYRFPGRASETIASVQSA